MAEEAPGLLSTDKSIIGLCTGLLAASAVSSISCPTSLIPIAVETVRLAFRLGLRVDSVADRLRPRGQDQDSWSVLVSGLGDVVAQCAIDDFHADVVRYTVSNTSG